MSTTIDDRLAAIEAGIDELGHLGGEATKLGVANRDNNAVIAYRLARVEHTQYEQNRILRGHGEFLRSHDEKLRDVKAAQVEHGGLLREILAKLDDSMESRK